MQKPVADARHIDATKRLDLLWKHVGLGAAMPKEPLTRTEGKNTACSRDEAGKLVHGIKCTRSA
jgi:hypothetical protein